jgi:hypothetical protein
MNPRGFRVPPAPTKNEKMRNLETELQNLQMASRVSQMMIQQMLQTMQGMKDDLGMALNQLFELQYKYTALQKHFNVDTATLDKLANEQRLKDFETGSAKEDQKENLTEASEVGTDSTVTITSTAKDETGSDKGIFRSRLKLSECGVPDLITALTGKKVGDKVTVKLNNLDHEVELLAIRNPNAEATQVEATH